MKKIIYFAVSLFALTFFHSCEKEIKFKGETQEPMIVMNGVVRAGEEIVLRLTESRFFLNAQDYDFKVIDNADVKLFVNDEFKEALQYKDAIYGESNMNRAPGYDYDSGYNGFYVAGYLPQAGDRIRIEASHPNFNSVEASLNLPDLPVIIKADTIDRKIDRQYVVNTRYEGDENGYVEIVDTLGIREIETFKFKVQFKDPEMVRNFYRMGLSVWEKPRYYDHFNEKFVPLVDSKHIGPGENNWTDYLYAINDPVITQNATDLGSIIEEGDISTINPYLMFDDALFDGETYTLNLIVQRLARVIYFDDFITNWDPPYDEIFLVFDLIEMTKEYSYFLQSHTAHINYFPLFSEPVQIYNNVKGGIGIVGGETNAIYKFRLK